VSQPRPSVRPSPAAPLDVETLVEQFEEAWQRGSPPRLGDFLALAAAADPAARAQLLEELVKVDLECRWSLGAAERPRLEDYAARHPDLGRPEQLAVELIAEEYRVRQRWGDHPNHAEYVARFKQQGPLLLETLQRIDAELTAEFQDGGIARDAKGAPAPHPNPPPQGGRESAPSVVALVDGIRRQELVSPAQLDTIVRDLQPRFPDPRTLGKELLQRGWLTAYQLNLLALGRGAELVMGPYRVLERLGEGGMGQVFKARHQRLERVVALKLIRKDLLADPEIVARFYREIQIISGLEHPNIILAYDAGPLGATHFLAMEYVEGTDLQRMVKQTGPLPLAQACDYVRQAALGLQYAHEKGLVHRDIKPSNLMVVSGQCSVVSKTVAATAAPLTNDHLPLTIVKILDLGLARLQRNAVNQDPGLGATHTLTPVGGVMLGTPDYAAPEQALDFHQADIRADIYSLGCTFFFLLTGQPPFADGTILQRLWRHQQAEPPPLDQFRPDIPAELAAILGRMLAKRPEDRYQSPAEVATALEPFLTLQTATRPAEFRRPGRRWGRPAVAALLLVSAALLALFWLPGSGDIRKAEERPTEPKNLSVATNPVVTELVGPFPVGHLTPARPASIGAVSSDGRWAAYLADNRVFLWNKENQKERLVPLEDADKTEALAFSADGKYLGVQCVKMVRVWSVDKDEAPLVATAGRSFAFAGNSQKLAVLADDASWLYDLNNPRTPSNLPRSDGGCALSEDGGAFAYAVDREDQKLTFLQVKKTTAASPANRLGHFKRVYALTFAPSRSILTVTATPAVNNKGGPIHLVDYSALRDRTNDFTINLKAPSHVCFAGNGQLLLAVSGSDQVHCWSVARASGRIVAGKLKDWKLPGPILAVAARDRLAAILLNDGRLYLLHLPEAAAGS
jgi:serine/threonine protein kinase